MAYGGSRPITLSSKVTLAQLVLPALVVAATQACGMCFTGGTWISLVRGRKRLRDVKVGDVVKTFDVRTGQLAERPVTRIFAHGPSPVGALTARAGAGPSGVTGNHPIFVEPVGTFAPAEDFDRHTRRRRGLHWDDRDLRSIELEPYRRGPSGHFLPVYNLSIAETETYFADGLLVHNKSTADDCDDSSGYPCTVTGGAGGGGAGSGGTGSGGEAMASGGASSGGSAGAAGSAGEGGAAGGEP